MFVENIERVQKRNQAGMLLVMLGGAASFGMPTLQMSIGWQRAHTMVVVAPRLRAMFLLQKARAGLLPPKPGLLVPVPSAFHPRALVCKPSVQSRAIGHRNYAIASKAMSITYYPLRTTNCWKLCDRYYCVLFLQIPPKET